MSQIQHVICNSLIILHFLSMGYSLGIDLHHEIVIQKMVSGVGTLVIHLSTEVD